MLILNFQNQYFPYTVSLQILIINRFGNELKAQTSMHFLQRYWENRQVVFSLNFLKFHFVQNKNLNFDCYSVQYWVATAIVSGDSFSVQLQPLYVCFFLHFDESVPLPHRGLPSIPIDLYMPSNTHLFAPEF